MIHAVRRTERDKLREIRFDIQTDGSTITIDANDHDNRRDNDNVVEADIEIQVPMHTRLDIKSFSAPVTVRQVEGRGDLDTFSGDLTSDVPLTRSHALGRRNVQGTLNGGGSGRMRLKTFSGDATVRQ